MRKVIIKEGPIVLIKNVVLMEMVAVFFFFLISFIENYEMLYRQLGFETYLRYQVFTIVAAAIFQFVYIIVLFIRWYFSYFEVSENEILKKTGIFLTKRKSFGTKNIVSVEVNQSILDRLIEHADIVLEYKNGSSLKMANVPEFRENIHILKQFIDQNPEKSHKNILETIERGENASVEFKESLRFDKIKKNVNKDLERSVMKTIVGFLNTHGGNLVIGVSNEGEIKGLQEDFDTLQRKNSDGFENHLNLLFKNYIGVSFSKYIDIVFEKIHSKEVCLIKIKPSHKPAFLRNEDKREEFFIRTGNSTQPLSMSEADEHIRNHFK